MSNETSRLGRTLKNLLLALLNATLLLILACLIVAYMLSARLEGIGQAVVRGLASAAPLASEVAGFRAEVAALRADIAHLATDPEALGGAGLARVQDRVSSIETSARDLEARLDGLTVDPYLMVDRAIETGAAELRGSVLAVRECAPDA